MKKPSIALLLILVSTWASARRIYVSASAADFGEGSSWQTAMNDLTSALMSSQKGDTIWVAKGIYEGGFIMKEGVTVIGGFQEGENDLSQRTLPRFSTEQSILSGAGKYRVIEQTIDFQTPTKWDGFVITGGIGFEGAGVKLRRNGILASCIVQGNTASMPSVGEYLSEEGGIVLHINTSTKRGIVMSLSNFGRHYQLARAKEAIKACNEAGKTDWRLPTNAEMLHLTSSKSSGLYAFTPAFYLIEKALQQHGGTSLLGGHYWTSTTQTESGNPVAQCFHATNSQLSRISTMSYQRIRPVRNVAFTASDGTGGGIFATDGSVISGCIISGNTAANDEDIHTDGNVIVQDIADDERTHFLAHIPSPVTY